MFQQANFLKVNVHSCKVKFFQAFNSIYGKIGNGNSFDTIVHLLKSNCLSVLLFNLESVNLTKTNLNNLEFPLHRAFIKIFHVWLTPYFGVNILWINCLLKVCWISEGGIFIWNFAQLNVCYCSIFSLNLLPSTCCRLIINILFNIEQLRMNLWIFCLVNFCLKFLFKWFCLALAFFSLFFLFVFFFILFILIVISCVLYQLWWIKIYIYITFKLCFISQFKCIGLHDSFEIKWNITILFLRFFICDV